MSTNEQAIDALRYPTGRVSYRQSLTAAERNELIDKIAGVPARMRAAVAGMDDRALDTPYRPGGWTARQVVHHVPDSHMNAYVRFKKAATENDPTISAYEEGEWTRLADTSGAVGVSLDLLTALHVRWTEWMRSLDDAGWRRAYVHPEQGRVPLERALQQYAWHGDHHVAHVRYVREQTGKGRG